MKGLVLEGGGAKGAYHCGAYKALYDYGYRFDGIAGTSIGAINAALIVQDNGGYKTMYDLWTGITPNEIVNFDNEEVAKLFEKERSWDSTAYWAKEVISILKTAGIPTDKVLEYLRKYIDEEKVRHSDMDYACVTYCLSDMTPKQLFLRDIPYGQLHEYILASAFYPIFKLRRLDGKFFIDGGVYDNLPTRIMAENDYTSIIAIRTKLKYPQRPLKDDAVSLEYILPSEDLGGTIDLYAKSIQYNIKLGYYDAVRFIKKQKGFYYYLEEDVPFFYPLLSEMNHEERERIRKIFAISQNKVFLDTLLQKIKPKKRENMSEEDIITFFLEEYAKKGGVEKFTLYTPQTFLHEIFLRYEQEEPTPKQWAEFLIDKKNKKKILLYTILDIYRRKYENKQ